MKIIKKVIRWALALFFSTTILMVVAFRVLPVYFTPLMVIRCFQQKAEGKPLKLDHHWVPLEEMSPHLPVAVMAGEDQRFLKHHGLDFGAIKAAAADNISGKRMRGGSTISQQTAKNVFLWPGRSFVRKGFEAYFTLLIEFVWGKRRIMEVYLNSIEMGDGIYGAYAVAKENFHTTPDKLTRYECALIAATLPNPRRFSSANPGPYMRKRQRQIEVQMRHIPAFPNE